VTPVGGELQATGRDRLRRIRGGLFGLLSLAATLVGVLALVLLFQDLIRDGISQIDRAFLTNFASRIPERAGIRSPLVGTVYILLLTAVIAFPISVAAAVYLEEYAAKNRLTRFIQLNIANLAGVPSIVYGILGLALFVRTMGLGRSLISGALTLALLTLPVLIIAAQEAIRAVPDSLRQAAYGLGATRWQVVRYQVLPMAFPGIMTGTILALSRAVGETAPLIMIGAVTFIAFTPQGLTDQFTVLPLQIYDWISRPQDAYRLKAAGAIVVLLAILLMLNGVAIWLRHRFQVRR
jgi:phosphate transport system permease protein